MNEKTARKHIETIAQYAKGYCQRFRVECVNPNDDFGSVYVYEIEYWDKFGRRGILSNTKQVKKFISCAESQIKQTGTCDVLCCIQYAQE